MSQAEARSWWADVEHLRERIESRRELERGGDESRLHRGDRVTGRARRGAEASAGTASSGAESFQPRRTVRIRGQAIPTVTAPRLRVAEEEAQDDFLLPAWEASDEESAAPAADPAVRARRRPRRRPAERVAHHPDRVAMWAFVLGIALVLAALLSAHGI